MEAASFEMLEKLLLPGETIHWRGRPRPGIALSIEQVIPLFIALAFSIYGMAHMVYSWQHSFLGTMFDALLAVVGLASVAATLFRGPYLHRTTVYAVTDQRIIIARAGPFPSTVAAPLYRLIDVTLQQNKDESGTISFGPKTYSSVGPEQTVVQPPRFFRIEDASKVFMLIQQLSTRSRA